MIGRQIGLIIGPAANFLVLNLDVKLGPFKLNNMTAPGVNFKLILIKIYYFDFFKAYNGDFMDYI